VQSLIPSSVDLQFRGARLLEQAIVCHATMQEALVYSQISATRVHQVLSILAGLTGTQPVPLCEQTLLFAQNKPTTAAPTGAARTKAQQLQREQQQQAARPHHHKLSRDLHSAPSDVSAVDGKAHLAAAAAASPWIFRAEQVPEPGTKEWLSRAVTEHVATAEELTRFRSVHEGPSDGEAKPSPPAYSYKTQYIVRGHRVVHANVVISIFQILVETLQTAGTDGAAQKEDPLDRPPPSPASLPSSETSASQTSSDSASWRLLDASGAHIVEATVRVADPSNARLTGVAVEELAAFKAEMAGAVDFYMPDRFALDTRVKA
jgi:mediator of RNA polymerase II transcription subunit 18